LCCKITLHVSGVLCTYDYSFMYPWWWLQRTPETCRVILLYNKKDFKTALRWLLTQNILDTFQCLTMTTIIRILTYLLGKTTLFMFHSTKYSHCGGGQINSELTTPFRVKKRGTSKFSAVQQNKHSYSYFQTPVSI